MTEPEFATGGCRCGAVRYTIHQPPVRMVQCHCVDCQKLSGTGHASQAFFRAEDVELHGTPSSWVFEADSGNVKTYHFCPNCGSRLHGKNSGRPGITIVPVGCLEDNAWFSPHAVAYTRARQDWDVTPDDIPNFETMPPMKG